MLVDLHTHILSGIDDGAADVETSLKMIQMLIADGITDIVLTPHFDYHVQNIESYLEKRTAAFEQLCEVVPSGIRLHLGAEVEFSRLSIGYDFFKSLTINNGNYILLELPFYGEFEKSLMAKLDRVIFRTGLTPIIAHIERYPCFRKKPYLIGELIQAGCIMQVNAESVIHSKKGDLVDAVLSHGQAHVLGTDCHNTTNRKPQYKAALDCIQMRYGEEQKERFIRFATAILNDEKLYTTATDRIQKHFWIYR